MLNLIVAGGGEAFYKNLYPATKSKSPDLEMKIHTLIDVLPAAELHPRTQEILEKEKVTYRKETQVTHGGGIVIPQNAAGVVMTPNDSHLRYAEFFADLGIPVYVEKPVATSTKALENFLALARNYPRFIYGAEYCVDGKALGFLAAVCALRKEDPRGTYVFFDTPVLPHQFWGSLGRARKISGKMLEGEGAAGTADHRKWLLDGVHGGMIRDLLSHLFGPLYDAGLAGSELRVKDVSLGRHAEGMPLGEHLPLRHVGEGETYALMEGRFLTPRGMPEFLFAVGKYWPHHDRVLAIEFEHGRMELSYEKPFKCRVETPTAAVTIGVTAQFYPALALLDFNEFVAGRTHGHIGRAAAIVRVNETLRKAGLAQAGLL